MTTDIGDHRLRCGSIMDGIGDLMGNGGNEQAAIFYSAPLHGDGIERNIKAQTMGIGLPGNPNQPVTVRDILHRFFELARLYTAKDAPVFVEYHMDRQSELLTAGVEWGLHRWATIDFGKKLPRTHLHVFTRGQISIPEGYIADLKDLYGLARITQATKHWAKPGAIFMDPCCGAGLTAQAAMGFGMRFRGNDPRASELDKTQGVLNGRHIKAAKAAKGKNVLGLQTQT